jgi:hypothetical protein
MLMQQAAWLAKKTVTRPACEGDLGGGHFSAMPLEEAIFLLLMLQWLHCAKTVKRMQRSGGGCDLQF